MAARLMGNDIGMSRSGQHHRSCYSCGQAQDTPSRSHFRIGGDYQAHSAIGIQQTKTVEEARVKSTEVAKKMGVEPVKATDKKDTEVPKASRHFGTGSQDVTKKTSVEAQKAVNVDS
jgi:hypothetical protein